MDADRSPVGIAIVGPTTSGKTALSLALAAALGGEVVSLDSRQVYRGMDIGTDKVSLLDRGRCPHHGLDLIDPDQAYSAGRYAREARGWIAGIRGRARVPVLAGGTGFFLKALLEPLFEEPEMNATLRERLRGALAGWSVERLSAAVEQVDPERAALAKQGGRQRLIRTLEVAMLTGRPLSQWHRERSARQPGLRLLVVSLQADTDSLDAEIEARVERMVERGLPDEVRRLLDAGFGEEAPGMTGTGYREVAQWLAGELTLDVALDEMKRQTRRYARRQNTWFRNQLPTDTLRFEARRPVEDLAHELAEAWKHTRWGTA